MRAVQAAVRVAAVDRHPAARIAGVHGVPPRRPAVTIGAMAAVLLDVDGTLVLSNEAHARAWSDALTEAGHDIAPDRIVWLIGMGGDRVLPTLVPGLSDEEGPGKRITDRRREIFLERYAPALEPAPGSRVLVRRLRDEGFVISVASSASTDELDALLRAAEVADLIEHATTSDDAESSKPAPDIIEAALERAGLAPEDALMFGDTPYDITAAAKAGIGTVAVRCGGWSNGLAGALAVYDDPADVVAHFDESPFRRLISGRGHRA